MFRFTMQNVLWLTVVVGLVLGWWMDHWRVSSFERELLNSRRGTVRQNENLPIK